MISKSELRIGNIIKSPTHNLEMATVEGILPSGIVLLKEVLTYDTIEKILPVSLTVEILQSFGFVQQDGFFKDSIVVTNGISLYQHEYGEYSLYGYNDQKVYVPNLHQLQNLYFALTGIELRVAMQHA